MTKFNGLEITEEMILKTRKYFHDLCIKCIEEAENGKFYVNNLETYREYELESAKDYMEGKNDNTFTFIQRAYFLETGESIPLMNF